MPLNFRQHGVYIRPRCIALREWQPDAGADPSLFSVGTAPLPARRRCDTSHEKCPRCGMPREWWDESQGRDGYRIDGMTYCCQGCAEGTGCTCRMAVRQMVLDRGAKEEKD